MNCRIAVTPTSTAISTYSTPLEWKNCDVFVDRKDYPTTSRLSMHINPLWRLKTIAEQVRSLYSRGGTNDLRQLKE